MKKIYTIIMLLGLITACSDDDDGYVIRPEALEDVQLSSPSINGQIELNSVNPSGEIVFDWQNSKSGLNSDVYYTMLLKDPSSTSADPLFSTAADNDGTATKKTFTNEELDGILTNLGLQTGEVKLLNWSVMAENGSISKSSNGRAVSIKRFVNAIAPFNTIAPANDVTLELDNDNPTSEIMIMWDSTYASLGGDLTYIWVVDEQEGDFSDPLLEIEADNIGVNHQLTLTHQTLEDFLIAQGIGVAEYFTFDWKVIASGPNLLAESNVNTLTLRRFNPVETKYLVGAATPGGWGWDNPSELTEVSDGVFQGTLTFANETFRIFNVRDDWGSGNNFPYFLAEGYTIDERFEDALDGDNNFRFIGAPGDYTFILNTMDKTIQLTVGESKFLVGAATPGGWGWDNPTELLQTSAGVWTGTLAFANDTFRVFDVEGDWGSGKNFPAFSGEGYTIDANFEDALDGDNNFKFIGTPGNYTFTIDSNTNTIILQ